jgi:Ca2+-binding RTX toxin-like protein
MSTFRTRAALAAALVSAGVAAAIPAGAAATVAPPVVNGNTLTVSADGANDTISLTAAGGFIAVNGTATTLAADDNAQIVVNAGDGRDTVDASGLAAAANYGSLTINGEGGDDVLTGGADADTLNGGDGDDREAGFRGNDVMNGGNGNDTLVWNQGDGTDDTNGDAGADDTEINGSAVNDETMQIGVVGGKVRFDRTAQNGQPVGNFGMNINTETTSINALGGDDTITGAAGLNGLTVLRIDGGTGNDAITGGDGADLIDGGDGNDVLSGGGGTDRIVGDRGNDTMNGGDGDDTLVWNQGDGSDVTNGDAGFDVTEVNTAGAADTMSVAPQGNRAKFERTAQNGQPVGNFSLDMDTEVMALSSFGGDDSLNAAPGLAGRLSIVVDAGSGNDALNGGDEVDTFLAGPGDDAVDGGAGADLLDGQDGNDRLLARDGVAEGVRGGAGTDSAQVDANDAVDGVESVDAPPAADTKALAAVVTQGKVKLLRRNGQLVARLKVACPAAEAGGCRSVVSITTAKAVKLGKLKLVAVLGSKSVALKGGQTATVNVKLASGAARLARRGAIAARAQVVSTDAAGNVATSARRLTLSLPKGKK